MSGLGGEGGLGDLTGLTAAVTGAASGIGLATTEAFVAAGMRVLMIDRDEQALAEHVARLTAEGADLRSIALDVTDPEALEGAAGYAVEQFGTLNVAMNNAGIVLGGNTWEISLDDWHRVIDVNLFGVVHGIRAFVPRIIDSGAPGWVVNTASMAAVRAVPGISPYTASKHAVLGISDVMRKELVNAGVPIGVSVVMPGGINTGMNPIGTVPAAQVAANIVDAIRRGRDYVFTDDHSAEEVADRLGAIVAARADVVS